MEQPPSDYRTKLFPNQLWVRGMIRMQNTHHTAVQMVLHGPTDIANYGIDEDGPVPFPDAEEYMIAVPLSPVHLNADQLHIVLSTIDTLRNLDDNGIEAFVAAKSIVSGFLQPRSNTV
ncbi:Hypothetical predicted protein [Paramuricea clavata]|uniref:Uncharacterized protein n=1 Tax=Paramuricea clavata TaxID=317549 RepID=A0A6S7G3C6_PARCT|nr:Hypothetical predicted protein [Paramuricea clavata]